MVEEGVVDTCRDEVVCVVEADEKGCVYLAEVGSDPIPDILKVTRGGGVAEEALCDTAVDRGQGGSADS